MKSVIKKMTMLGFLALMMSSSIFAGGKTQVTVNFPDKNYAFWKKSYKESCIHGSMNDFCISLPVETNLTPPDSWQSNTYTINPSNGDNVTYKVQHNGQDIKIKGRGKKGDGNGNDVDFLDADDFRGKATWNITYFADGTSTRTCK